MVREKMELDFKRISSCYRIRRLTDEDVDEIFTLCKGNADYYKYMKSASSAENIRADLCALPPGKTMDDKFFIGFYADNGLIAVMDLITGYPNAGTAYIGLFMMDKNFKGTGKGSGIIQELLCVLKQEGFDCVRLGCIRENLAGRSFWLKNGFDYTGVETQRDDYAVMHMHISL